MSSNVSKKSDYDYGEPRTWKITWVAGHTEEVTGHQCTTTQPGITGHGPSQEAVHIQIHGVVDGDWELIFSGRCEDITSVTLVRNRTE